MVAFSAIDGEEMVELGEEEVGELWTAPGRRPDKINDAGGSYPPQCVRSRGIPSGAAGGTASARGSENTNLDNRETRISSDLRESFQRRERGTSVECRITSGQNVHLRIICKGQPTCNNSRTSHIA